MTLPLTPRVLCCASLAACLAPAGAQSIALDLNVAVSRVGDGATALTAAPTPVFVDSYKVAVSIDTSGPIPVPVFSTSSPLSLASGLYASGIDSSQGVLNISGDRRSVLMGAADSSGSPTLVSWAAGGLADGQLNPAQPAASLSGAASGLRGAWSADGLRYYAATTGPAGVQTGSFGSQASPVLLNAAGQNMDARQLGAWPVYGQGGVGQGGYSLAYSAGSAGGGVAGIYQLGNGLPQTAGQVSTLLAATQGGATPDGFFFADLSSAVPGVDTLYVATSGGGLQKFTYTQGSDGTWRWIYTSALAGVNFKVGNANYWDAWSVTDLDGYSAPALSLPDGQGGTTQTPAFAAAALTASHHRWSTTANGTVVSDKTTDELDAFVDFSGYGGDMGGGGAWVSTLAGGYDSSTLDLRGVGVTPGVTVAVPEPTRPALLMAGLLATGWRLRRVRP